MEANSIRQTIDLPRLLNKSVETLRAKRKELTIEYEQKLPDFVKPDYPRDRADQEPWRLIDDWPEKQVRQGTF